MLKTSCKAVIMLGGVYGTTFMELCGTFGAEQSFRWSHEITESTG